MSSVTTSSVDDLTRELIAVSKKMFAAGVMFRGEHANLSARLDNDRMVMTRGGNIGNLGTDDFAVVNLNGAVLSGSVESVLAEVVSMHAAIYRVRPEVGAVIHNHAPHVTAFALAHEPIPAAYEPLLRFGLAQSVPVVPWAPRGSKESVQGIVSIVEENPNLPAVLLANHGVLAFAATPAKTAQLLIALEEAAELVLMARQLGGEKPLPAEALSQVQAHMARHAAPVRQ